MAWCRLGDNYLNQCRPDSLTHICGTRPQWVKLISREISFAENFVFSCRIVLGFAQSMAYSTLLRYIRCKQSQRIRTYLNGWHNPARAWWRHQMETFSALLDLCAGNSPVKVPIQRPVTRSFDVFYLRLNKRSWSWWLETPLRSLWRHCNGVPPCPIP